jgi:predicted choloylglycine hydrolase
MEIKIVDRFTASGGQFYEWWLYSGPDGVEEVHGYASDLITAFSKIMEWHERIASDYANNIVSDIETTRHFITTDDSYCEPTN